MRAPATSSPISAGHVIADQKNAADGRYSET
jgi:hypothetical protein